VTDRRTVVVRLANTLV